MRHERTGSSPPLQATAERRCPACRAVKPPDDFPAARADTPAGCCGSCRRRSTAVARRAEAGHRALLAQHTVQGGGGGAA